MIEISIECDGVSASYKGDAGFLEEKALEIIAQMLGVCARNAATRSAPPASQSGNTGVDAPSMPPDQLRTRELARQLNAKTGTELAMAAIAYLAIVANRSEFSRREILSEMRSATGFYKANMSSNLGKSLEKLKRDGRLNEIGKDKYSLPETERERLVNELA